MKYFALLTFMFISTLAYCQISSEMTAFTQSNIVRISAFFQDTSTKKSRIEIGRGFVLRGKYLGTCYHIIYPRKCEKLTNVLVYYNERDVGNKHLYDSVSAEFNFKTNKHQYDFSKHLYDSTNYETDFVVLKLVHSLPTIKHDFLEQQPSKGENLFCCGNVQVGKLMMNLCQSEIFALKYKQYPFQTSTFWGCYAKYDVGCSGSLLYNKEKHAIGMVQFSMKVPSIEFIKNEYYSRRISSELANDLAIAYDNHVSIQYSINIDFLIEKYLKGYMN